MQVSIIRVGNSKGIRFSKTILEKYGISENDTLEMDLEKDKIVLRPTPKNPREGWAEQFRQMHQNGDDKLLMPDVFEDEKLEDWTW
jgi:antitoxin MazE